MLLNRQSFWIVALLLGSFCLFACNSNSSTTQQTGSSEKEAKPINAKIAFATHCGSCHQIGQLPGRTAEDIRNALKTVKMMKGTARRVSAEEIDAMGTLLGGDKQKATPSAKNMADSKYKYLSATQCKSCHAEHFEQWKHSLHALAHTETIYNHYFVAASIESDKKLETFCARCHTPIAVFDGDIPFPKKLTGPNDTKVNPIQSEGLQCDFCHLIDGRTELANGNFIMNESDTKFGPLDNPTPAFHKAAYRADYASSEYCGTCHNVNHPGNGIVLESTYTEWKNSQYATDGVTCQHCHMTKGLSRKKNNAGAAGMGGMERPHVSDHYFVGPNLVFADEPGKEELNKLSKRLLESAAILTVDSIRKNSKGYELAVSVENVGAGHGIPTGVSEIREAWLFVEVKDAQGKVLYTSGELDDAGNIKEGSVVYQTDVIDQHGNVTTKFWNTVKKVRDYRIMPHEKKTETYALGIKPGAKEVDVYAELRYRSVSPKGLAEVALDPTSINVPIITMAKARRHLKLQ